jgi:tRNA threonylcarbamoyladenosine biosynthesis protein TsaB
MKILAADTALGACSCAVLEDSKEGFKVLAHRFVVMERGHAEALAPMVQDAMHAAGLGFAGLDRLAVTVGPGTFTGQRVGLAFMRGLRIALNRPLNGVTTLAAMAAQAMAETGLPEAAVLHDARRDEVYYALYRGDQVLIAPSIAPLADACDAIRKTKAAGPFAVCGTAADPALPRLGGDAVAVAIHMPDALYVARLALAVPPSATAPRPLYLRAPDAKLPAVKLSGAKLPDIRQPRAAK